MEFEGAVTVDGSGHYLTVHLVAEPAGQVEQPAAVETPSTSAATLTPVRFR
jgi:hypothetical protein